MEPLSFVKLTLRHKKSGSVTHLKMTVRSQAPIQSMSFAQREFKKTVGWYDDFAENYIIEGAQWELIRHEDDLHE